MRVQDKQYRPSRVTEAVIREQLEQGDSRRAFELMLEAYERSVYAYCARAVGFRMAPLVYRRVMSAATCDWPVKEPISLRAWLFRLARTTLRHHQLAESARISTTSQRRDDPQLKSLDSTAQEVLKLALWCGLELKEIAHVLEISHAEVRRHAADGLMQLAQDRDGQPS